MPWQLGGEDEGLIRVHVAADPFETDILMNALEREGIRGVLKKHEETAYDGLFVLQRGWAAILVPAEDAERAKEIVVEALEAYKRREPFLERNTHGGTDH